MGRKLGNRAGELERHKRLAEGVVHEGKTFKQSALDCGYSPNTARQGQALMRRQSSGINKAFIEASRNLPYDSASLKAMSLHRLVSDISNGKSTGVERSVELLARFKEHDWLVRTGDVQIGVFASLVEDSLESLLPPVADNNKKD